jgi:hypothetical protein
MGDSGDRDAAKIFVGALSWDTSDDALKDAFIKHGEIVEARVSNDRDPSPLTLTVPVPEAHQSPPREPYTLIIPASRAREPARAARALAMHPFEPRALLAA